MNNKILVIAVVIVLFFVIYFYFKGAKDEQKETSVKQEKQPVKDVSAEQKKETLPVNVVPQSSGISLGQTGVKVIKQDVVLPEEKKVIPESEPKEIKIISLPNEKEILRSDVSTVNPTITKKGTPVFNNGTNVMYIPNQIAAQNLTVEKNFNTVQKFQ